MSSLGWYAVKWMGRKAVRHTLLWLGYSVFVFDVLCVWVE